MQDGVRDYGKNVNQQLKKLKDGHVFVKYVESLKPMGDEIVNYIDTVYNDEPVLAAVEDQALEY